MQGENNRMSKPKPIVFNNFQTINVPAKNLVINISKKGYTYKISCAYQRFKIYTFFTEWEFDEMIHYLEKLKTIPKRKTRVKLKTKI